VVVSIKGRKPKFYPLIFFNCCKCHHGLLTSHE
jgi:hypothetical protein